MDLSVAYGAGYFAAPLGMSEPTPPPPAAGDSNTVQELEEFVAAEPRSRRTADARRDVYSIHVEIGRDDVHLLCMFIAALILSLLFSSRK